MTKQRIHRRRFPRRANGGRKPGLYSAGSNRNPVLQRKPRVFVSFHTKDRYAKELLLAQAKNKNIALDFTNQSVNKPFSSKWKTRTKNRIRNSSTTVVMVGKDTYRRKAVNWEVEQSRKSGNKIIAVQIHKNTHHRIPPTVRRSEEIKWDVTKLSKRIRRRK